MEMLWIYRKLLYFYMSSVLIDGWTIVVKRQIKCTFKIVRTVISSVAAALVKFIYFLHSCLANRHLKEVRSAIEENIAKANIVQKEPCSTFSKLCSFELKSL
ncbi:hypothetical protein ACKWTF_005837 [Chironomus riparius]